MIISKSPLRVSFIGGGTDIPEFYEEYGAGSCISTTIDKYVYVAVNTSFGSKYRIAYRDIVEYVDDVWAIKHNLIRGCLEKLGIHIPTEIVTMADMPGTGLGLGSSSATTVGTLLALSKLYDITGGNLPLTAFSIERLYSHVGKQDQYAAVYGGFKKYAFGRDNVHTTSLPNIDEFFEYCNFLWLGPSDKTVAILQEQSSKVEVMLDMPPLVTAFENAICDKNYIEACVHIARSWQIKKKYSADVTNAHIDTLLSCWDTYGGIGGKVLGSGGGGILMLLKEPDNNKPMEKLLEMFPNEKFLDFKPTLSGANTRCL